MKYCESYLKKYFDNFKFFDIDCTDKRIREVAMRIKRCLKCKGFEKCKMHPDFWFEGERIRFAENERLLALEKEQEEKERLEAEARKASGEEDTEEVKADVEEEKVVEKA